MDHQARPTPMHACDAQAVCNLCGAREAKHLFTKAGYRLVKCRSCDLAFIANPPDAEALIALYTAKAAYHDELLDPASKGFVRMQSVARQHLAFLARNTGQTQGLRLLDVGCSSGLFLAEARAAGFEVAGAELSPETSAFARKHFLLPVHTGDWRNAGYADASFDVITLFDVIEHLADPMGELVALHRLLKPGGLLLQSTPDIGGLFPRLSYKVAHLIDYWPHPEPPWHLFQFSAHTLAAMTGKAGYHVSRVDRTMIDLGYSFGTPASWKASPKLLLYALAFAPVALMGNWLGKGDWLYLAARKADH